MNIRKQLFELRDEQYALFHGKLIPNILANKIIGVRVPICRKLAKSIKGEEATQEFLESLPHEYYDENILHAILVSEMNDYQECIEKIDEFLPYVDNWAVCDILAPKILKKNKDKVLSKIREWIMSSATYTCRFGIEMLMTHFLEDEFEDEYLELVGGIHSEEYYVNMMIAWFFATALAKQWDATIIYIEKFELDVWTHNKTIQKARESRRITVEQKVYLKTLKR